MIKTEKVSVTREEIKIVEQTCDLCGRKAKRPGYHQWLGAYYDISETEICVKIRHKEGEAYPDGGSGKEITIDMCPYCFKDKLVPWLRSQGAEIKYEEWEW